MYKRKNTSQNRLHTPQIYHRLYSREFVNKTELAITSQRRNMNECNAHDNIRFLDVYKCL